MVCQGGYFKDYLPKLGTINWGHSVVLFPLPALVMESRELLIFRDLMDVETTGTSCYGSSNPSLDLYCGYISTFLKLHYINPQTIMLTFLHFY